MVCTSGATNSASRKITAGAISAYGNQRDWVMTTAPYRSRPRERGDPHSAADTSLSDLISPERLSVRVHGRQDAPGLWVPAFAGTTTGATAASRSSLLHRTHALAWRIGRPA